MYGLSETWVNLWVFKWWLAVNDFPQPSSTHLKINSQPHLGSLNFAEKVPIPGAENYKYGNVSL